MPVVKQLYVPADLPTPPAELRDAATYCLHRMMVGRGLWDNRDDQNRFTPYTRLYSPLLQEVVRNYNAGLEWLHDKKVVESDNYYIVGRKSKGYRWRNDYREVKRTPASPKLSKRMFDVSRRTYKEYTVAQKHLIRWLRRATMDTAAAMDHIETLSVDNPLRCKMNDEEYRRTLAVTVKLIQSGEWEDGRLVCDYGRLHSPYTSLLSGLRQYVQFDGEHLVNVDIANSQPLVLALLFPQPKLLKASYYAQSERQTQTEEAEGREDAEKKEAPVYVSKSIPLFNVSADTKAEYDCEKLSANGYEGEGVTKAEYDHLPADMRQYQTDCEAGQFYNQLMAHFNVPPEDRGTFKQTVFREIYYGTATKPTELRAEYIRRYPNVWKLIKEYKAGNYRRLAWAMQRAESRIMIDAVGYRLATEHPDVPVITIHDSIMTTAGHVDTVQRLMREEFGRVGLRPTLKTESTVAVERLRRHRTGQG